jgi:hypothetical protein
VGEGHVRELNTDLRETTLHVYSKLAETLIGNQPASESSDGELYVLKN